jgi:hypothetical protein
MDVLYLGSSGTCFQGSSSGNLHSRYCGSLLGSIADAAVVDNSPICGKYGSSNRLSTYGQTV